MYTCHVCRIASTVPPIPIFVFCSGESSNATATMTSLMLAGLGIAGAAFGARILYQSFKQLQKQAAQLPKSPLFTSYYRGGFDVKMSRREAGLILGETSFVVSPAAEESLPLVPRLVCGGREKMTEIDFLHETMLRHLFSAQELENDTIGIVSMAAIGIFTPYSNITLM